MAPPVILDGIDVVVSPPCEGAGRDILLQLLSRVVKSGSPRFTGVPEELKAWASELVVFTHPHSKRVLRRVLLASPGPRTLKLRDSMRGGRFLVLLRDPVDLRASRARGGTGLPADQDSFPDDDATDATVLTRVERDVKRKAGPMESMYIDWFRRAREDNNNSAAASAVNRRPSIDSNEGASVCLLFQERMLDDPFGVMLDLAQFLNVSTNFDCTAPEVRKVVDDLRVHGTADYGIGYLTCEESTIARIKALWLAHVAPRIPDAINYFEFYELVSGVAFPFQLSEYGKRHGQSVSSLEYSSSGAAARRNGSSLLGSLKRTMQSVPKLTSAASAPSGRSLPHRPVSIRSHKTLGSRYSTSRLRMRAASRSGASKGGASQSTRSIKTLFGLRSGSEKRKEKASATHRKPLRYDQGEEWKQNVLIGPPMRVETDSIAPLHPRRSSSEHNLHRQYGGSSDSWVSSNEARSRNSSNTSASGMNYGTYNGGVVPLRRRHSSTSSAEDVWPSKPPLPAAPSAADLRYLADMQFPGGESPTGARGGDSSSSRRRKDRRHRRDYESEDENDYVLVNSDGGDGDTDRDSDYVDSVDDGRSFLATFDDSADDDGISSTRGSHKPTQDTVRPLSLRRPRSDSDMKRMAQVRAERKRRAREEKVAQKLRAAMAEQDANGDDVVYEPPSPTEFLASVSGHRSLDPPPPPPPPAKSKRSRAAAAKAAEEYDLSFGALPTAAQLSAPPNQAGVTSLGDLERADAKLVTQMFLNETAAHVRRTNRDNVADNDDRGVHRDTAENEQIGRVRKGDDSGDKNKLDKSKRSRRVTSKTDHKHSKRAMLGEVNSNVVDTSELSGGKSRRHRVSDEGRVDVVDAGDGESTARSEHRRGSGSSRHSDTKKKKDKHHKNISSSKSKRPKKEHHGKSHHRHSSSRHGSSRHGKREGVGLGEAEEGHDDNDSSSSNSDNNGHVEEEGGGKENAVRMTTKEQHAADVDVLVRDTHDMLHVSSPRDERSDVGVSSVRDGESSGREHKRSSSHRRHKHHKRHESEKHHSHSRRRSSRSASVEPDSKERKAARHKARRERHRTRTDERA